MKTLLFDLMDTVIRDPYREAIEAATGLGLRAAHSLKDPLCWPEFEIAKIDEQEFFRRFFVDPEGELRLDLEAFHRVRRANYRFVPGMRELLTALQGRVERYVASNYPIWIEELRTSHDLDGLFEGVWASHHLGVRKPAPEFFHLLLTKIEREPADCLFIDDRRENCAAAELVGVRAHHFVEVDGLRERLRAEGVAC